MGKVSINEEFLLAIDFSKFDDTQIFEFKTSIDLSDLNLTPAEIAKLKIVVARLNLELANNIQKFAVAVSTFSDVDY